MLVEGEDAAEEGEGEEDRLGSDGRWERDVSIGDDA